MKRITFYGMRFFWLFQPILWLHGVGEGNELSNLPHVGAFPLQPPAEEGWRWRDSLNFTYQQLRPRWARVGADGQVEMQHFTHIDAIHQEMAAQERKLSDDLKTQSGSEGENGPNLLLVRLSFLLQRPGEQLSYLVGPFRLLESSGNPPALGKGKKKANQPEVLMSNSGHRNLKATQSGGMATKKVPTKREILYRSGYTSERIFNDLSNAYEAHYLVPSDKDSKSGLKSSILEPHPTKVLAQLEKRFNLHPPGRWTEYARWCLNLGQPESSGPISGSLFSTHFLHSEQNMWVHLDGVKEGSNSSTLESFLDQIFNGPEMENAKKIIRFYSPPTAWASRDLATVAVVMHLHSRLDICQNCALSLHRECEMGVCNAPQSLVKRIREWVQKRNLLQIPMPADRIREQDSAPLFALLVSVREELPVETPQNRAQTRRLRRTHYGHDGYEGAWWQLEDLGPYWVQKVVHEAPVLQSQTHLLPRVLPSVLAP